MKTPLIILSLFFVSHLYGQYGGPARCIECYEPFNLGRSTDSRSEAMGLTSTTTTNNINTSYYNPAGLGTLQGVQGSVTHVTTENSYTDAGFLYTAVGGKINDYIKVQFSRFSYRGNFDFSSSGRQSEQEMVAYTLGIGSEPVKGWYFGGNLKLIEAGLVNERASSLMGDLGVIKKFELAKKEGNHTVNLGLSVMNFTASSLNFKAYERIDTLDYPVTGFGGFSYRYSSVNIKVFESLDLIGATIQADYVNQLNLDSRHGYRMGAELALMELIYLRGGYYSLDIPECNPWQPNYYIDNIQSLTYGFGIAVPLETWTKLPLTINVDYANLPQPSYTQFHQQDGRFTSINTHITWEFN